MIVLRKDIVTHINNWKGVALLVLRFSISNMLIHGVDYKIRIQHAGFRSSCLSLDQLVLGGLL